MARRSLARGLEELAACVFRVKDITIQEAKIQKFIAMKTLNLLYSN